MVSYLCSRGKPQNDHCSGLREQTSNSTESSVFAYIDNIVYLLSLSFQAKNPVQMDGVFCVDREEGSLQNI